MQNRLLDDSLFLDDPEWFAISGRKTSLFEYLTALVEKEFEAEKRQTPIINKSLNDSEQTAYDEEECTEHRTVRKMFRRVYIYNEPARTILSKQLADSYRRVQAAAVESVLKETLQASAKVNQTILTERLQQVFCKSRLPLQGMVQLTELYRQFQYLLQFMNILLDSSERFLSHSRHAAIILRYLELANPDSDFRVYTCDELHIRGLALMLAKTPIVTRVCSLLQPLLKTNSFQIHQSLHSREHLQLMIQLCLNGRNSAGLRKTLSPLPSSSQLLSEQNCYLIQYLRTAVKRPNQLLCLSGGRKFQQKIDRKLQQLKEQHLSGQLSEKQPQQYLSNSVIDKLVTPKKKNKKKAAASAGQF